MNFISETQNKITEAQHNKNLPMLRKIKQSIEEKLERISITINSLNTLQRIIDNELFVERPRDEIVEDYDGWLKLIKRKRMTSEIIPGTKKIYITNSIAVNAREVATFSDVKQDGVLYYIASCNHFAIVINNILLHGNIGTIYTNDNKPKYVKSCTTTPKCSRIDTCTFYHDPLEFVESSDVRNFVNGAWIYNSDKTKYGWRRFGSLDNIDTDIMGVKPIDISDTKARTMHDILCLIAMIENT